MIKLSRRREAHYIPRSSVATLKSHLCANSGYERTAFSVRPPLTRSGNTKTSVENSQHIQSIGPRGRVGTSIHLFLEPVSSVSVCAESVSEVSTIPELRLEYILYQIIQYRALCVDEAQSGVGG